MENERQRKFVEAPAGHGKTETIVRMVSEWSDGSVLILTHTNAGVSSLRKRLKRMRVPSSRYELTTIDSFSLKFSQYYPSLSGISKSDNIRDKEIFKKSRVGAFKIFTVPELQEYLRLNYSFLIVDEYQDCSLSQHSLVMKLSEVLDCVVFGDPMQAIFGFDSEGFTWKDHLLQDFTPSDKIRLDIPERWERNGSRELGDWIKGVRQLLMDGKRTTIDFNESPESVQSTSIRVPNGRKSIVFANEINKRIKSIKDKGSVLVIAEWGPEDKNMRHSIAQKIPSPIESIEKIDSDELFKFLKMVDSYLIGQFALNKCIKSIRDHVQECMIGVPPISSFADKFVSLPSSVSELENRGAQLKGLNQSLFSSICDIHSALSTKEQAQRIVDFMMLLNSHSGRYYRRELWDSTLQSLRLFSEGEFDSLSTCGHNVRSRASFLGRGFSRVIGTTLLTKGLEYDHVILVAPHRLNDEQLYVALSRARKTLHIIHVDIISD